MNLYYNQIKRKVSTHSRPKAAAITATQALGNDIGFNTQPPEGGCLFINDQSIGFIIVSTHSRPKAAAVIASFKIAPPFVSTHSRPKAAALAGYQGK